MTQPNARPTREFDLVDAQHFLAACDLDGFRARCHDARQLNVTMIGATADQRRVDVSARPLVPTNRFRT